MHGNGGNVALYNWSNISDHDFEAVCRDVLADDLGTRIEIFARGPDGGIDLRGRVDGGLVIGQAKHYLRSSFGSLETALKGEVGKLDKLDERPSRYILLTSHELTPGNKAALLEAGKPYIHDTSDIWGLDEIDGYVANHSAIETANYKLWLASVRVLQEIMANPTLGRSKLRVEDIMERSRLFVPHAKMGQAQEILKDEHAVIISGPPGIGKTTLAEMLAMQFIARKYGVFFVTKVADLEEHIRRDEPQLFVYDDFLGRTNLREAPSASDQERLFGLLNTLRQRRGKYLIMTTREYLYREARTASEGLRTSRSDVIRCLLNVGGYDQKSRAEILYNHLYWNSAIPTEALSKFVSDKGYWKVIRHPQFNPRWIADTLNRLAPPPAVEEDAPWT